MGYKLIVLKRAEKDLEEILDYKAGFYLSTPDKFIDELEKHFDSITENPYICQEYIRPPRKLAASG